MTTPPVLPSWFYSTHLSHRIIPRVFDGSGLHQGTVIDLSDGYPEWTSSLAPSALSHQSRFFFRESPEQIDLSPDRAGSALDRAGNDDRPNSRDVSSEVKASLPENVQRTTSERSDSLDEDVSVHPGKALTATSSSVGSKGSKHSTSLPRNRKGSTTMPTAAITTTAGATTTRGDPHLELIQISRRLQVSLTARTNILVEHMLNTHGLAPPWEK